MTAPARAAEFGACANGPTGFECATLPVPLDRSGAVPGTIDLRIARQPTNRPATGTLLALTGGPGGAALEEAGVFAQLYDAAVRRGYRLVTLDQRGTGASGALDCPSLQPLPVSDLLVPPPGTVEACGERLGPARAAYATTESVEDLEALRIELGVERWAIAGSSYATYVAERYARRYPDRVERLVLDSVVPQENVDPLERPNFQQAGTILREQCARGACRRASRDPSGDLAALVARLARGPVRGPRYDGRGRRIAGSLRDGAALLALETDATFQPSVRAHLPAATRAALDGDGAPLVRIAHLVAAQPPAPLRFYSQALHAATLCADLATPWGGAAAPIAGRDGALQAAVDAIPPAELAPFDRATAAGNGLVQTCLRWPPTAVAPPPAPGPLPDVPVLILAGGWDLSTPPADARKELARASRGEFVLAPKTGHGVIGQSRCAGEALARFFADQSVGDPCRRERGEVLPPTALPPRRLADVAPARGIPGLAGRAAAAVLLTIDDATFAADLAPGATGGLRGGTLRPGAAALTLRRYAYVPGLRITGRSGPEGFDVRVSGAASGRLRGADGVITGRLAGRSVRIVTR